MEPFQALSRDASGFGFVDVPERCSKHKQEEEEEEDRERRWREEHAQPESLPQDMASGGIIGTTVHTERERSSACSCEFRSFPTQPFCEDGARAAAAKSSSSIPSIRCVAGRVPYLSISTLGPALAAAPPGAAAAAAAAAPAAESFNLHGRRCHKSQCQRQLRLRRPYQAQHCGGRKAKSRWSGPSSIFSCLIPAAGCALLLLSPRVCAQEAGLPSFFSSRPPTIAPNSTRAPTRSPTRRPTPAPTLFPRPSNSNTSTTAPVASPPTARPTRSPTVPPTLQPTTSPYPSQLPSDFPTNVPTTRPSSTPTSRPTFLETSIGVSSFRQSFLVQNTSSFAGADRIAFESLYESYTAVIIADLPNINGGPAVVDSLITTDCTITTQANFPVRQRRLGRVQNALSDLFTAAFADGRELQTTPTVTRLEIDYIMRYESQHINVTSFPDLFEAFIDSNSALVAANLRTSGLNVTEAGQTQQFSPPPDPTPMPTIAPSTPPTIAPTISSKPSVIPTRPPNSNTTTFSPTAAITLRPSVSPPPMAPTTPTPGANANDGGGDGVAENTIIVVSVVLVGAIILICLFVFYQRRKKAREQEFQRDAVYHGNTRMGNDYYDGGFPRQDESWNPAISSNQYYKDVSAPEGHNGTSYNADHPYPMPNGRNIPSAATPGALVSPSESLVSNQSLLSAGISVADDSGDEADGTYNLADEFDQYKDQNLEKMRTDVEGNLSGFDGMMSQALTKALIDDDDAHFDPAQLSWGGAGLPSAAEIEASALGEVMDWLRRYDMASIEDKRAFMQHTLNQMVASVRHGIIGPDDATRTIHECGALLGLQLSTEIPDTTVMISGMRTTVIAEDVVAAFEEFGEISEAAVASKPLGFGILRFKSNDSVNRMMTKFRNGNIFVNDVAVQQLKILKPGYNGGAEGAQPSLNRSNRS